MYRLSLLPTRRNGCFSFRRKFQGCLRIPVFPGITEFAPVKGHHAGSYSTVFLVTHQAKIRAILPKNQGAEK